MPSGFHPVSRQFGGHDMSDLDIVSENRFFPENLPVNLAVFQVDIKVIGTIVNPANDNRQSGSFVSM